MEKEKINYLAIILAFCVLLAGFGGFWLGTNFGGKEDVVKEEEPEKEEEKKDETDKENTGDNTTDNDKNENTTQSDIDKWNVDKDVKTAIKMMNNCHMTKEERSETEKLTEKTGECDAFYWDAFEDGNQLANIAGFLMITQYDLDSIGLVHSEGYYHIVDDKGLSKTKEYFNVILDEFDNQYFGNEEDIDVHNYINKGYYLLSSGGDGCGCEEEMYTISGVKKENGNYIVSLDMRKGNYGNDNESPGDVIGKAELSYTYKNNHIYYNYFNVTNNNDEIDD